VHDAVFSTTGRGTLVRTARWAFIDYGDGGAELYDMEADPRQYVNVADHPEYAGVRKELAALLAEHSAVTAEP
jgi:hypothetical protein